MRWSGSLANVVLLLFSLVLIAYWYVSNNYVQTIVLNGGPSQNAHQETRTLRLLNLAPFEKVNLTLRSQLCLPEFRAVWGNKHHGGWYVCANPEMLGKACIVYSYGLGNLFDIADQF
jgi:hypothetical protein